MICEGKTCQLKCYFFSPTHFVGAENYENFEKYALFTFKELENLNANGLIIDGQHHDIKVISCSDWKACACIEGDYILNNLMNYTNRGKVEIYLKLFKYFPCVTN